jgi:hypothetical protein
VPIYEKQWAIRWFWLSPQERLGKLQKITIKHFICAMLDTLVDVPSDDFSNLHCSPVRQCEARKSARSLDKALDKGPANALKGVVQYSIACDIYM